MWFNQIITECGTIFCRIIFFLSVLLNLVDFVISLLMSNEIRARPLVEKDIGTVGVGIVSVRVANANFLKSRLYSISIAFCFQLV